MRKRWLFILLCAISVQLIVSEDSVDENGYSSETISSDPSANLIFYREEAVNGSEFMSERPKVRRSRSTPIDDYNSALIEHNLADETANNVIKAREEATAVLNKAKKELEDAEKELKSIEEELTKARSTLAQAKTENTDMESTNGTKYKDYETAKTAYDGVLGVWTPLDKAANDAYDAYKDKKDELDEMEKEGSKFSLAQDAASEAAEAVTTATEELVGLQEELTKADKALTKAKTDSEKNKKTIEDYKNYGTLKTQRDEFKKSKDDFTKQLRISTEDTTLDNKKKVVENNMILENHIRVPFLYAMTFKEALAHCKKSQLPSSTMNSNDKSICLSAIPYLEQLEPYYGTANVQKCVDGYVKLKADVDEEIRLKNLHESDLNKNATAAERDRKKADDDMKTILKQYGDDFQKLKGAASRANNSKVKIDKSYSTAETEQAKCAEKVRTKSSEIGPLQTKSDQANTELKPLQDARNVLAGTVDQLKTTEEAKRRKADDNKRDKVDPAKKFMDKKYEEYEKARDDAVRAAYAYKNADDDMPVLLKKEKEATTLVGKKTSVKKAADEAEGQAKENERVALLAVKEADTNVKTKREAKEEYEKTEAEKQILAEKLKIALGAFGGVVVLVAIGGVIAFVLRKRQKKKKAREEEEAKGPKKTKWRDECGLMRVHTDGEAMDRYQVDGADIKVREKGTTFHRWHNYNHETMNWKHKMDGPEGEGIKSIKKIFFDMDQVEAIPTGEKHDIIEGGDSVTRSESSVKDNKRAKSLKEKTAKDVTDKKDKKKKESSSNPQSSDEKQSGSKSNRAASPSSNPPPSSPRGEEKKKQ